MAAKRGSTGNKGRKIKQPQTDAPSADALTLTFRKVGGGYNLKVVGAVGAVQPNGWTSIPFSWIYPSRTAIQAPVAGVFNVQTSRFQGEFRVLEAPPTRPRAKRAVKKAPKKAR